MATETRARFIDYLPAVFRKDEVAEKNFLGGFLQAFEAVFEGIQKELNAIPDLFAAVPTPVVVEAQDGKDTLQLDSAAGLCPGDILHILDSDLALVEFIEVKALPLDIIPTVVALSSSLRFNHAKGTPVLVVGVPGPAVTVSLPLSKGETVLTVAEAKALGATRGDVLRIDEGKLIEYVQVVDSVTGNSVTVTPPLLLSHEAGRPVVLMKPAPRTTPPLAFAHAVRAGAELALRTTARVGETVMELDTVTGLSVKDILHLHELEASRVEFVQVKELPPEPVVPGVLRFAIRLNQPLCFDHAVGVEVGVLGDSRGKTRLTQRVEAGAKDLTIDDPDALGAEIGDVLRVGEEEAAPEYAQILAISDRTVTVTPLLQQGHDSGKTVERMASSGSGTAFLSWLAGWIGLALRPARGERWNRELLRLAGRIWPWRGTKVGIEAFLNTYLRGEALAEVFDPANPLQIGLVSTVGVDTFICGGPPNFFWADLVTNEHNSRLYHPDGLNEMVQAVHQALRRERPAHTYYDLSIQAHTMQIGVDPEMEVGARVGDTTLLWGEPLIISGDR